MVWLACSLEDEQMDKLRVGVIGVGSVVREIYQYLYFRSRYSDILDIVAVADPNDEYRTWFCDTYGIPEDRRFTDHREMLRSVELDAAHINTPDHLHTEPAIDALQAGLDVQLPKPVAAKIKDVRAMAEAARRTGRLIGVDFHKREDPRMKELAARYQSGRYGTLQVAVWWMVDALQVANPNHTPRFFATRDFAETNTPASFLTVHMADTLMLVVDLQPVQVQATGYSQALPALSPVPIHGYDLIDTQVRFENGAVAHIITGWHLPDTAPSLTVQSSRMICTKGMIDIPAESGGFIEIHPDGIFWANPLFRTFEKDGTVTGFGMSCPGNIFQAFLDDRNGCLSAERRAAMFEPFNLGFQTTLVLEGAERSLAQGEKMAPGVTVGPPIDLRRLALDELGPEAARAWGVAPQ